jgi:hypothetical protein
MNVIQEAVVKQVDDNQEGQLLRFHEERNKRMNTE